MQMSHQKFYQEEGDTVTFKKFLNRIEQEEKELKNPKTYSLKIMEARKQKNPKDTYYRNPALKVQMPDRGGEGMAVRAINR